MVVGSLPPFCEVLRAGLHFLPRQHLNSASHFTQNEGCVSQTGSNWPLPWFPHWKEPLEEGGGGRWACHMTTQRKCPVFVRPMDAHTDVTVKAEQRGDSALSAAALRVP